MHGKFLPNVLIACGIGLLVDIAALRFSPALALGGLLGVILLIAIANRPEFGLLVIILITGNLVELELIPALKLGPISLQPTDILLFYLLALVLIKVFILRNSKLVRTPLDYASLLLSCCQPLSQLQTHQ